MQRGKAEDGARAFVDGVVEEGTFDQFPPEVQGLILDNVCELKIETSSPELFTPFTCADARRVTTPTLLLSGDRSLRMLQSIVDELHRCLPNSESVRVPETTHEVSSDNPEAYNEIVLEFLARHVA